MIPMPKSLCACGALFESYKELRVHIAMATDRWPMLRCTPDHHDPRNEEDLAALRWVAAMEQPR
jgi:hypothetical protein